MSACPCPPNGVASNCPEHGENGSIFRAQEARNRARLKTIEDQLKARGMKDIKFAWSEHRHLPGQYVIDSVCDVLEAFLAGKVQPLPPFNDLPSAHPTSEKP